MERTLDFDILAQPDDITCGPTSLHAVYRYHGLNVPLKEVIETVVGLDDGGTLAVQLGLDALRRGFAASIYTYNLQVFDPTWWNLGSEAMAEKLKLQREAKNDPKLAVATEGYLDFLALGGELRYVDLTPSLFRRYLKRGLPVLTGLSSTYLYQGTRERPHDNVEDDINGEPAGHFVVVYGYNMEKRTVMVADPLAENPLDEGHHYEAPLARLVCAVLLGVITYDANLLVIEPKKGKKG